MSNARRICEPPMHERTHGTNELSERIGHLPDNSSRPVTRANDAGWIRLRDVADFALPFAIVLTVIALVLVVAAPEADAPEVTPNPAATATTLEPFARSSLHASRSLSRPTISVAAASASPRRGKVHTPAEAPRRPFAATRRALGRSAGVWTGHNWNAVARCESGGHWHHKGGLFEGGLQFMHSTWVAAGGRRYAEHAYLASKAQQIAVAESWLAKTSWRQWPICGRYL